MELSFKKNLYLLWLEYTLRFDLIQNSVRIINSKLKTQWADNSWDQHRRNRMCGTLSGLLCCCSSMMIISTICFSKIELLVSWESVPLAKLCCFVFNLFLKLQQRCLNVPLDSLVFVKILMCVMIQCCILLFLQLLYVQQSGGQVDYRKKW